MHSRDDLTAVTSWWVPRELHLTQVSLMWPICEINQLAHHVVVAVSSLWSQFKPHGETFRWAHCEYGVSSHLHWDMLNSGCHKFCKALHLQIISECEALTCVHKATCLSFRHSKLTVLTELSWSLYNNPIVCCHMSLSSHCNLTSYIKQVFLYNLRTKRTSFYDASACHK